MVFTKGLALGLCSAFLISGIKPVHAAIGDGADAAIEAFAEFIGLGNEALYPTKEEYNEASLVEKVNYLKEKVESMENTSISFKNSSWKEIRDLCRQGRAYELKDQVGSTHEIVIGTYTENGLTYVTQTADVMLADISQNGSEITCIITNFSRKSPSGKLYSSATEQTQWKHSNLREILNDGFYKALPTDLKEVMAKTNVVDTSVNPYNPGITSDYLYIPTLSEIFPFVSNGKGHAPNIWDVAAKKRLLRE